MRFEQGPFCADHKRVSGGAERIPNSESTTDQRLKVHAATTGGSAKKQDPTRSAAIATSAPFCQRGIVFVSLCSAHF